MTDLEEQKIEEARRKVSNSKVKDLNINLEIADNGMVSHTTSVIKGKIEAIMIDTDSTIKLDCVLGKHQSIIILNMHNVAGSKYIPIRTEAMNSIGDIYNYQVEQFCLNDKLVFRVMGKRGTTINITVRYS